MINKLFDFLAIVNVDLFNKILMRTKIGKEITLREAIQSALHRKKMKKKTSQQANPFNWVVQLQPNTQSVNILHPKIYNPVSSSLLPLPSRKLASMVSSSLFVLAGFASRYYYLPIVLHLLLFTHPGSRSAFCVLFIANFPGPAPFSCSPKGENPRIIMNESMF